MNKRTVVLAMFLILAPMMAQAVVDRCDDPKKDPITVTTLAQKQEQMQGQAQGINAPISNNIQIINPDRILTAPVVDTLDIPIYQNGKVTNWNDWQEIPIQGMTYLKKGEVVVKVLNVISGIPGWRVRLEDVLTKLIDNKIAGPKVRYFVMQKGAVTSGGFNLLSAASAPIGNGMGTGAAPMGYTESTVNPQHIITFVEIQ